MNKYLIISLIIVCLCLFVSNVSAQNIPPPDKSLAQGVTIGANDKIEKLRLKAAKGDAQAQLELGSAYYNGKGVEQDYEKAVEWFRKSAEQGNAEARKLHALCEGNSSEQKSAAASGPEQAPPQKMAEASYSASVSTLKKAYADKQVGERFHFGHYPQGANGEVKPITWRVLKRESGSLLVISDLCLDAKPYHDNWCDITWSECTLRDWLNGEFINQAFNAHEQSLIKVSRLANNAGPETEDRVFLLSVDEAKSLFVSNYDREAKPTIYAIHNGAYTNKSSGNSCWRLRSRGLNSHDSAGVFDDGFINYYYHAATASVAVRPVLRLAI